MRTHPGRVVAGDMFDAFALDADRVGICFGDVTGQAELTPVAIAAGRRLADLRAVLVTHCHYDHARIAYRFARQGIPVMA